MEVVGKKKILTERQITTVEPPQQDQFLLRAHDSRVPQVRLVHASRGSEGGLQAVHQKQQLGGAIEAPLTPFSREKAANGPHGHRQVENELHEGVQGEEARDRGPRRRRREELVVVRLEVVDAQVVQHV